MTKRMKMLVIIGAVAVAMLITSLTFLLKCLFSVDAYIKGATSYGAVAVGDTGAVELWHESLTFDTGADATVTTEYGFSNPGSDDCTLKLAVPYNIGGASTQAELTVTAGEERVNTASRYTYADADTVKNFDIEKESVKLRDGCREHEFFSPDLTVTRYRFKVKITDKEYLKGYADFMVGNRQATVFYMPDTQNRAKVNNGYRIGKNVRSGDTVTVFVIGARLSSFPEWRIYKNSRRKKTISGVISVTGEEVITFKEYVAGNYVFSEAKASGVSLTDYYNATVDMLERSAYKTYGYLEKTAVRLSELTAWREYELTVPAGEKLTNTVVSPIAPSVDRTRRPDVYNYSYKPTAAVNVKNYNGTYIRINTPYNVISGNVISGSGYWQHSSGQYTVSYDGVPGEMNFAVCLSKKPRRGGRLAMSPGACVALVFLVLASVACVVIGGFITDAVLRIRRGKRRERLSTPDR